MIHRSFCCGESSLDSIPRRSQGNLELLRKSLTIRNVNLAPKKSTMCQSTRARTTTPPDYGTPQAPQIRLRVARRVALAAISVCICGGLFLLVKSLLPNSQEDDRVIVLAPDSCDFSILTPLKILLVKLSPRWPKLPSPRLPAEAAAAAEEEARGKEQASRDAAERAAEEAQAAAEAAQAAEAEAERRAAKEAERWAAEAAAAEQEERAQMSKRG